MRWIRDVFMYDFPSLWTVAHKSECFFQRHFSLKCGVTFPSEHLSQHFLRDKRFGSNFCILVLSWTQRLRCSRGVYPTRYEAWHCDPWSPCHQGRWKLHTCSHQENKHNNMFHLKNMLIAKIRLDFHSWSMVKPHYSKPFQFGLL